MISSVGTLEYSEKIANCGAGLILKFSIDYSCVSFRYKNQIKFLSKKYFFFRKRTNCVLQKISKNILYFNEITIEKAIILHDHCECNTVVSFTPFKWRKLSLYTDKTNY